MARSLYYNPTLFERVGVKEYVNRLTGQVFNNPLSVEIISKMWEKSQSGLEIPEKQQHTLEVLAIDPESTQIWRQRETKRQLDEILDEIKQKDRRTAKEQLAIDKQARGEDLVEFIDYDPAIDPLTPPNERQWEQAYNNFMEEFLELTNPSLFMILRQAFEKTGLKKSAIGQMLNMMPEELIYQIGYGGEGYEGAFYDLIQSIVYQIPSINEEDRQNIMDGVLEMGEMMEEGMEI